MTSNRWFHICKILVHNKKLTRKKVLQLINRKDTEKIVSLK